MAQTVRSKAEVADRHARFRQEEYPQIGTNVYADWAGAALTPQTLVKQHQELLGSTLLGNPHSSHTPSAKAKQIADEAREAVLQQLGATDVPGDRYEVIFTANATAAILLLNHVDWANGSLLMVSDNHNSVNGLRLTAGREGAKVTYNYIKPNLEIDEDTLQEQLQHLRRVEGPRVFAYPLKSNYSGVVHGLNKVADAQKKGWKVLLDASSYLANHTLDLKSAGVYPDFIPISFYKIFGYPSGLGCLVVRRSALKILKKKHFSGGSIVFVNVRRNFYIPEANGPALYEDGTIPFLSTPMVKRGYEFIGKARAEFRNQAHLLATALHNGLSRLSGKRRRIVIHNAVEQVSDTVSFNVVENDSIMDPDAVERAATEGLVHLRSGCHCNPGCNEAIFGYRTDELEAKAAAKKVNLSRWEDVLPLISKTPVGALRASFGIANNMGDVDHIVSFFKQFIE